jgi:uncharacterized protein
VAREFLGTGWAFPIRVGPHGGLEYVSDEAAIARSVWIVLGTVRGERQMLPRFGCGMQALVFASTDPATRAGIAHQVRQALLEWEARIDVLDVRVDVSPDTVGVLLVRVDYRVRATNSHGNVVYPFYVAETAGV